MSALLPRRALDLPSPVAERLPSGRVPVVVDAGLTLAQRACVAAWLGVPLPDLQALGDAPLLMGSLRDARDAEALRERLAELGLPVRVQPRVVAAWGHPAFTFLTTAALSAPLLAITALIELIGLAVPMGAAATGVSLGSALLYVALVIGMTWRKVAVRSRRAELEAPLRALSGRLAVLREADPEAAGLRERALALRREVLALNLSPHARGDLLAGMEEVLVSLSELGLERARVLEALASEGATRVRQKLGRAAPPEGSALAAAAEDLRALEDRRRQLDEALVHIEQELDVLELSMARLHAGDGLRTEGELAELLDRAREVRRASEEVVVARIPVIPTVRSLQ